MRDREKKAGTWGALRTKPEYPSLGIKLSPDQRASPCDPGGRGNAYFRLSFVLLLPGVVEGTGGSAMGAVDRLCRRMLTMVTVRLELEHRASLEREGYGATS